MTVLCGVTVLPESKADVTVWDRAGEINVTVLTGVPMLDSETDVIL